MSEQNGLINACVVKALVAGAASTTGGQQKRLFRNHLFAECRRDCAHPDFSTFVLAAARRFENALRVRYLCDINLRLVAGMRV